MSDENFASFEELIRAVVRSEVVSLIQRRLPLDPGELLTAEELSERLKVPVSWVYEQSRQGKIPTYRLGHYIRFSIAEVLAAVNTAKR